MTQNAMQEETRPHIIFDAIHQVMRAPAPAAKLLKRLMDLPVMQRLRAIKQAAVADMVFPTATHSRFSHVLGTCHLAGRMLQQLRIDDPFKVQVTLAAALLHDIGHGPFSHSIEEFLKDPSVLGFSLKHEGWTKILFTCTDIEKILIEEVGKDGFDLIVDLITLKGEDRLKLPDDYSLLGDIISSQLDADRLDYLLRDSHFCGVSYGNYDLEWLLTCLLPLEFHGRQRLGIARKGVGAVEQFLSARRLMYQNIYYNKSCMAWEKILIEFLKEMRRLIAGGDNDLEAIAGVHLTAFLKHLSPRKFQNASQLLQAKVETYQLLCDYDVQRCIRDISLPAFLESDARGNIKKLALRLHRREAPVVIRFNRPVKNYENILKNFQKDEGLYSWQISTIEHSTFVIYSDKAGEALAVKDDKWGFGDAKIVPLKDYSPLMTAMGSEIESQRFLMIDNELYSNRREAVKALIQNIDS